MPLVAPCSFVLAPAMLQVQDREELFLKAKSLLDNESLRSDLGEKAFHIIARNQGTTRKAMEAISSFL